MVKLEDGSDYEPKDTDAVTCDIHGTRTTWGALDTFQRLALEEGLDTQDDMVCLLAPERSSG